MTIPEIFAAAYAGSDGDVIMAVRAVLDEHAVRTAMRGRLIAIPNGRDQARALVARVAMEFRLTVKDLVGQSRVAAISYPRYYAMWVLRNAITIEGAPMSYPEIGRVLGGRDHSTIIAGVKAAEKRLALKPQTRERLIAIVAEFAVDVADESGSAQRAA